MPKNILKNYIYPAAVFCGGMVGVGFLSLPYLAKESGALVMLFYFVAMTALVILLNLMFCDISLKTPDFKRFPGFVGYYLGKWAKAFSMAMTVPTLFGILLVYLVVGGQFLQTAFGSFTHTTVLFWTLLYFLVGSAIIYFDIKIIARVEFSIMVLLLVFILQIFIDGFPNIKLSNIFLESAVNWKTMLLPFGPMLFAFWNIGLILEVEEMVRGGKKNLKKIIVWSTISVATFYLVFTFLILGITGQSTDQTALQGLKGYLPNVLLVFSVLVGALATFVAFITQGIIFKKTLIFDFKIRHWQAFVITCVPPIILFLMGMKSFIPLISFVGGIFLGLNGLLILLMYRKIKSKSLWIYPLAVIFLLGIIYQIIYFVK